VTIVASALTLESEVTGRAALKLRSFFACVLVVVFGCVGFAQTPPTKATVWLYRPDSDRSDLSPIIYVQEGISSRKLARLEKGQFFGIQLSAGNHAFSWTNAPAVDEQFVITLEPGQQAYLEVKFHSIARVDGKVVDTRGLRPVDSNNVFDSAVIAPVQGVQIAGTGSLQSGASITVLGANVVPAPAPPPAPVTKADPAPAVATVPSPSAPPSTAEQATFTSDEAKPRGQQSASENGKEGLNTPRRFEMFLAPASISRWGQMNLYGSELELAVKITDRFSLIADVGDHRSINGAVVTGSGFATSGHVETFTYRFGPKFSIRPNDRFTIFGHAAAGRTRVKATYDFGDGFTLDALGNGLVISGGGGVDIAIKKWLGIRLAQAEYNHNRIDDSTWHDVRIGSGLVFRIK
jgi:hypothetical protein